MANRSDPRNGYGNMTNPGGDRGRGERERWYESRDHERDERLYGGRADELQHREHEGFSNYAGGGDRDLRRTGSPRWDFAREDMGFGWHEPGDEAPEERGPHYGKGPKGYKRSDERIREEVCETIARQGWIDASDVEVKVEDGVVTLSGTVEERHEKRRLEQMVERVYGVDEVENEIRLRRVRDRVRS